MTFFENTLRLSFQKDPLTLDPQKSGDQFSSAIIFLLFRGLTRLEADHSISCDLAESFHILNDHKKYIFFLGKHFWSDGSPITAHDFVYSWKRALSPAFPLKATNFFFHLKNGEKAKKGLCSLDKVGVYAKDDSTLVIELAYPCAYFLELTSFCPFFPVSSKAQEKEIFSICSGPYRLDHWTHGQEIVLKRGLSSDYIHVKIIADEKKAFSLFENDELDWIGDPVSPLPTNHLSALIAAKKIKSHAGLVSCWFNTLKPPFSNVNLRKAFALAIPRQELLEKLLPPNTGSATRFCPSILPEKEITLIQECITTAKDLFQKALEELGIKQLKVSLAYEETDEFSRIALFLKTSLENIFKISIQLNPLTIKEFSHVLPQNEFQMCLFCTYSQYLDSINFLERFESRETPRNFSGWENSKYKLLLKNYRATADLDKRQGLAAKAETILLEEMPIVPLYYHHYAYLQKPRVKNLFISPIGVIQFDRVILEKA